MGRGVKRGEEKEKGKIGGGSKKKEETKDVTIGEHCRKQSH